MNLFRENSMEDKLRVIFDFQKFQQNERLSKLIGSIDDCSLSEDELSFVTAAGSPESLLQRDQLSPNPAAGSPKKQT